jgi:hypothetical protein
MINFLKRQKLIIFLSVLVGLLYIGPSLMVWKNFDESGLRFVSIQHKKNSPEIQQYLSRAREIYDGHFPPAEIYGSQPAVTMQNPFPSTLFSGFLFLFGGNVNLAHLTALFLFSAIIFVLFYLLGKEMFKGRIKSLFFAVVAVLTPIVNVAKETPFFGSFSDFKIRFLNSFLFFIKTQFAQLPLDRFDEPLLTYPIYLSAIIFFVIFWKKPSTVIAIFSGFFAGLLFFTYFHHWVYWTIVIGILFIYTFIFKRKENPDLFKNYLILLAVLVIMFIPYLLNYIAFNQMPSSNDFSFKVSTMRGHYFGIAKENIIDYLTYAVLGALVYLTYWKKDKNKAILFFGFILAMFAVWNVQLVTGVVPLQAFFRRTLVPIIFLIVFSLFYNWLSFLESKRQFVKKYITGVLICLIFFVAAKNINNIYSIGCCMQPHISEYSKLPSGVIESWDWINNNFDHEPKIISSSVLTSLYLPAYTSARPFLPTAYISMLGIEETDRRYLVSQKLFGVESESIKNIDLDMLYGFYFLSKYGSFSDYFSTPADSIINRKKTEKIDQLTKDYFVLSSVKLADFDADYVYVGPWEKETSKKDFARDNNLEMIYKNSEVDIYKIIR